MLRTVLSGCVALSFMASVAQAASVLGAASDFNAFVFSDALLNNASAAGRLAVGGDATLKNYGVGSGLIVGGDLKWSNSQLAHGDVLYGGTASLKNVSLNGGTAQQGVWTSFASLQSGLTLASSAWGSLPVNGHTTVYGWGGVTLSGSNSSLNVFSVSGDVLQAICSLSISAPAGSTVLVNIVGASSGLQNAGLSLTGVAADHLLFNFIDATALSFSSVGLQGTVLAPHAAVAFNNASLCGTLIADSLSTTAGGALMNGSPFAGNLPGGVSQPADPVGTMVPLPSAAWLAAPLLAWVGWRNRRRVQPATC